MWIYRLKTNKKKNLNDVGTEKVPFVDLAELLKKNHKEHILLCSVLIV